ncbi:glycoprotease family-domain-containing protein [Mycena metata]|uniref:N(6)-L-threonylcarbamoyladenine synthase n=1 Tax=Mycena metata TaxID=1033252 RepID=A0AAD7P0B5_9AGAR|nr:glycoprotease family-domain-containing protein [Mycena metata]
MLHASRIVRSLGRPFRVLALESSADDTCAAVVDSSRRIWSNVIHSQHELHQAAGGIQPLVALLAHQRNMPSVVQRALAEAKLEMADIDGVAFTRGPGIPGCLSVCCNAAKTLAAATNKPLVGVHHMQAHTLTPELTSSTPPQFPFLSLLVSGGHTMIVHVLSRTEFRILVNTVDKSIGAAIDRVVTLLKIPWTELGPGPGLESFCAEGGPNNPDVHYPPPEIMRGQLAFSYAGLHSWVERTIRSSGGLENVDRRVLARTFQAAAFDQLGDKLLLAINRCRVHGRPVKELVVSGGVASNTALRLRLQQYLQRSKTHITAVFPDPALCVDNAAMIAWASMHRFEAGDHDDYSIDPLPSWSLDALTNPPPNIDSSAEHQKAQKPQSRHIADGTRIQKE